MESGAISNGQVRASTEWNANHAAIQARLYFEAAPDKAGSWSKIGAFVCVQIIVFG